MISSLFFRLTCLFAHLKPLLFVLLLPIPLSGFASSPELLLASQYHSGLNLADYRVSEKLDGVRAYWNGTALLSRQGNRFAVPAWFSENFPDRQLDGELWMGRESFDELSGIVRRNQPHEGWRRVRFMVFDLPDSRDIFDSRLQQLKEVVRQSGSPYLFVVEHLPATTHKALMRDLDSIVAAGGEGLMLRKADSTYRGGRSDDLLKVKKREDAEAKVVRHIPGKGKYTGQMGALLVEMPDGRRFRLGTGFTDAVRAAPPAPGSWVTFTYQGLTSKGLPRFASFWRERPEVDLPNESTAVP